jgi:hypothetical protein
LSFGPVRLNLSESGLGISVGVPGLRIGKGPRGAYVHAGRKGLYYRRGLPSYVPHHAKLSPEDMTRVGGLWWMIWIIFAMALILLMVTWASVGTVQCTTREDTEPKRWVTTCTDGARAITRYDEELQRWNTQIITPPKGDKPPPGWPVPGKLPR